MCSSKGTWKFIFLQSNYTCTPVSGYRPHSEEMGKVIFSQLSVCPLFRGVPHPADRGYPYPVADLRGARGTHPPFLAQNFFVFMQFSGKIGQIIGWCPPFRVSAPSSGKSLIRHCYPSKWGATSILPDGGTPIPGQGQGVYPGYPLSMSGPRSGQGGYPHPRSGAGGYPHAGQITGQSVGRIPHLRSG